MFAAVLLAQAVTILVGGRPLHTNPGPIVQTGRVFVPMRSIFERMGATVVYNSGNINATRDRTTVALRIGSTSATIDGQNQQLDVAPFIVGATTYVPLRFIAQSLGANVNYDNNTRVVAITNVHVPPYNPGPPPPPYRPAPPPPQTYIQLYAQQPEPNVYVNNRFAPISAQFTHGARPASVRVYLDGNEITYRAGVHANGFSYSPPAPLSYGAHRVRVTGLALDGTSFDRAWTFTVNGAPPPSPIDLRDIAPGAGTSIVNRFATIAANFTRDVVAGSVRVDIDGDDRTNQCAVSAQGFSFKPPAPLSFGSHRVRVTGRGPGGAGFDRSWSFTVKNQGGGAMHLTIDQPSSQVVSQTFTVAGNSVSNARVVVTVGVPPASSGQASQSTTAGPLGNFRLVMSVPANPGQQSIKVKIVATDPVSGQSREQILQLRLK